ncbi:conserved hypothetical protein [Alkaliphilus metalliredigens QYMF]|uniref:Bacteriocin-associated integral membrane protein n=1 Tax=Alkaliphilus metalliredigens (strain QYMF) TaxID=293826 RepID=A6TJH5_ALKMQ|nr:hypothetical protein [Alkaliphilus metalliredigens]ABR46343.1 conserved hypothetical protein [Alkaliphilus metalliredigens QYMF]
MKRTYKTLLFVFFLLFTIVFTKYYGIYEHSRIFTGRYDFSINLRIVEDISKEDVLSILEEYGERYDMDMERTIAFPGDGKYRRSLTAYVFINDFDWFNRTLRIEDGKKLTSNLEEGEFLSNIETTDENQVGKFSIFDDNSQEIYIRPLADMKNRVVESNYKVHLNNDKYTLEEIINTINQEQESLYVEKGSSIPIYVDINEYDIYFMYYIGITLLFILILGIISFIYDIIGRNKNFGIKKLYGHSNFKIIFKIFKEDIFKVIIFSNISSILVITILLYFKNGFIGFGKYFSTYFLALCAIDLILMITLTTMTVFFKGRNNIQLMLKGKRRNIIFLNANMKIIMSTIVILMLIVNLVIFNSYNIKNNNLNNWDKAKNLGFIGVNFSYTIDISDNIQFYPYSVKLGNLWNDINDNGGIMAEYQQLFRSDIIEKEKMLSNLAYGMLINENYLKENIIFDENGNRITQIDDDKDTLTVLVPSQFKEKEELLKKGLRYFHLGNYDLGYKERLELETGTRKESRDLPEFIEYIEKEYSFLNQKIIYTKDNQKMFTYDTGEMELYRHDFKEYYNEVDNTITDSILVVVSNDNLKETRKYAAIMSGTMKFRFEDYKYPEDGIVPLLEKNGLLDALAEVTTVYDYAVDEINNTRTMLILSVGISIICIVIMLGLIFYESSNYLYRNKKKIGVFKLYGLGFLKRYKSHFIMISIINLITIILSIIIGPIFLERFIDSSVKIYYLIIVLGILFYLLELIITYLFLNKRENKSILIVLKGEL